MKQNFFQGLLIFTVIGILASCQKERADLPVTTTENEMVAKVKRPPILPQANKLAAIKRNGVTANQFTYDNAGQIASMVTNNPSSIWPVETTTYTSDKDGNVLIKRWPANRPGKPTLELKGHLNKNGRVSDLRGFDQDGNFQLNFYFHYDAAGHLTSYHLDEADVTGGAAHTILNHWDSAGNIDRTYDYIGDALIETKYFSYDQNLSDNRGVWNDIHDIWTVGLFGTRNKNLCTKIETRQGHDRVPSLVISQNWTVKPNGKITSCLVTNPSVGPFPVAYTFDYE